MSSFGGHEAAPPSRTDLPASDVPPASDAPPAGQQQGVRAQLLATEHWSLLAARGMTWSEVMSRISIHLTIASASLVVLALVTQASGFGTAFKVLSIGLTATVLILGTLTAVRVHNASRDDEVLIIGMNRLRAAYIEIDPTLAKYFVTGWNDDMAGVLKTYWMGNQRSIFSHVVGSTTMFMNVINTIVAGTLGALIADAAGGGSAAVTVSGAVLGLAYLGVAMEIGRRSFGRPRTDAVFPTESS